MVMFTPTLAGRVDLGRRTQDGFETTDLNESREIINAFARFGLNSFDVGTLEADPIYGEPRALATTYDAENLEALFTSSAPTSGTTGGGSVERQLRLLGAVLPSRVFVFDWITDELLVELPPPEGNERAFISTTTFDSSGERMLIANLDGQAVLYDAFTWEPIDNPIVEAEDIAAGRWSQTELLVATASSLGVVSIRDGETFRVIRTMTGATGTGNTWGGCFLLRRQPIVAHQSRWPGRAVGRRNGQADRRRVPDGAGRHQRSQCR